MDILIQTASQYGAIGLILLASFWYINKKDNEYKDARNARDEVMEAMHEKTLEVVKSNTSAMAELSTIIKSK